MNPLDDLNQRLAAELGDYVYNIGNRPDNAWLRFMVVLQGAFCAAVGGGLSFVLGACAGVEDGYALMGLIALGGVDGLWWCLAAMRRVGRRNKAEYGRHGGTPREPATSSSAPWSTRSCRTAAGSGRNQAPAGDDPLPGRIRCARLGLSVGTQKRPRNPWDSRAFSCCARRGT